MASPDAAALVGCVRGALVLRWLEQPGVSFVCLRIASVHASLDALTGPTPHNWP